MPEANIKFAGYLMILIGVLMLAVSIFILVSSRTPINDLSQTQNSINLSNQKYNSMIYNLSHPDILTLKTDTQIIVAGYVENYMFSNDACSLFGGYFCDNGYKNPTIYNNYTEGSYNNMTFLFPNDGYLILKIIGVNDINNQNIQPTVGTFSVTSYSNSSAYYYVRSSGYPVETICINATTEESYTCPITKPSVTGFSIYPLNSTATYTIPVSRGYEILTFGNYNKYAIDLVVNLTYVGIKYSNLTQISVNYT